MLFTGQNGFADGRGALNLKIHPQGLLSISFMFQLLQWVSFQKNALHFQILLFFQTTDLLPHLFQVSIHGLAFVGFVTVR